MAQLSLIVVLLISGCQSRNKTYRPPAIEFEIFGDDALIKDVRDICRKTGRLFCSFRGYSDQDSYTGCMPYNFENFCCNDLAENNSDCESVISIPWLSHHLEFICHLKQSVYCTDLFRTMRS